MHVMRRRSFLHLALAALPFRLFAQALPAVGAGRAVRVAAGTDREGKKHAVGVSSTTYKVLTQDTGGALFVLEQLNHKKGGPNRHLHREQDELFYVLEGEYIVEIGDERFHLHAGDCVLGPRKVAHAWAFVGDASGRLLISFSPAGQMEAFFNDREQLGIKPGTYSSGESGAAMLHAYGMELVGPPLVMD